MHPFLLERLAERFAATFFRSADVTFPAEIRCFVLLILLRNCFFE